MSTGRAYNIIRTTSAQPDIVANSEDNLNSDFFITYFMVSEQKCQDKKLILGHLWMKAAMTAIWLCSRTVGSKNKDNQDARERFRSGAKTLSQFVCCRRNEVLLLRKKDTSQEKDVVVIFFFNQLNSTKKGSSPRSPDSALFTHDIVTTVSEYIWNTDLKTGERAWKSVLMICVRASCCCQITASVLVPDILLLDFLPTCFRSSISVLWEEVLNFAGRSHFFQFPGASGWKFCISFEINFFNLAFQ